MFWRFFLFVSLKSSSVDAIEGGNLNAILMFPLILYVGFIFNLKDKKWSNTQKVSWRSWRIKF